VNTQILQIEPHDDAISTRDKMGGSQTSRILLVFPARGDVLSRRLDLVLLQRHSRSLGAELALVASDPEVRLHADQLGIPRFRSIRRALESGWTSPPSNKPWRNLTSLEAREFIANRPSTAHSKPLYPAARYGLFSSAVLAVFSVAALLFPSAEIRLVPAARFQEVSIPVKASRSIDLASSSGLIPIHPIRVVVEGRDQIKTTGTIQAPAGTASGEVVFTNLTDREIAIPAGTFIGADRAGTRYATERDGLLPSGPGATLVLPVKAVAPGGAGNLAAGRIHAIYGGLGTDLTVSNPGPIQGGTETTRPAPSPRDREKLNSRLLSTLQDRARQEIEADLLPGDMLLVPDLALTQMVEEIYSPSGMEQAQLLDLFLRLQFEAQVISGEDLQTLAAPVLDADLPEGYAPASAEIEIVLSGPPRTLAGPEAELELKASRAIQASFPQSQAAGLAVGLSPVQAVKRLAEALPLDREPQITLWPAWWPRLPAIPLRISVIVDR
jgi:hypothetical protein